MSAIWGVIDKKSHITEDIVCKMQDSMKDFRIDDYRKIIHDSVYFACGRQFFTRESVLDNVPLFDDNADIVFTADCVLSNREELLEMLAATYDRNELITYGDGQLSYKAYLLWGECFVEKLRGSFSFAVYDNTKKELLLYADHFARRYLAYYVGDQKICFSSLYQPILSILEMEKRKINRAWITAAYSDCTADTVKLHGATVYENIFHVEPGQYVKINIADNRIVKRTYWNPLQKNKKIRLESDEEYRELFLSTFQRAVDGLLRTDGKVGIMLSGGLDSSSVAAFAAAKLGEEGKRLYSYTSVPADEYEFTNTALTIENEREYVWAQQKMHPNIYPQFINANDTNCFTKIESHVACYREPVKPILNLVNSHEMMKKAAADGCRIMLSGQNGNATISYGRIMTYVYQKIVNLRWNEAYQGIMDFCKMHHLSKKRFLKVFLKTFRDEKLKNYRLGEDCFLKQADIVKYNVEKQERKIVRSRGTGYMDSKRQREGFGFMPLVYQHMGFFDTYDSLRYGILSVDPTLTKEVVELCLGMPIDCFVRNGKERRAIRDYMKGYVPDTILDNYAGRGVQAADYAFRVNRDWNKIRDDVNCLLSNPKLLEYLDGEKLQKLLQEIKANEYHLDKTVVAEAAVISSLSSFLNMCG